MARWRRCYRRTLEIAVVTFLIAAAILGARGWLIVAAADLQRRSPGPILFDRYGNRIRADRIDLQVDLPLDAVSPYLRQAVVASEDHRFYVHPGIDPVSIARASLANWRGNGVVQGASTITQQVVKNVFLTPERTFRRKLEEAVLALAMEARYSKDEILELYLNRAYFGEGAYGAEAAARIYFGKGADELTLGEAALLAGLLPAPNRYSPFRNPERALQRRRLVLDRMVSLGMIDREEAQVAAREPLSLVSRYPGEAPYFSDFVIDRLVKLLGPELTFHGNLRVDTTLDLNLQRQAEQALGERQGAIVVLDVATGDILAMVGGRDYRESQFNRATRAKRQPGSAFKPFVYAAALEQGWTLNSLLRDEPRSYGSYEPKNWNNRYWGPVTMKLAMAQSLNAGSVWLLSQIGPDSAIAMARRLGIHDLTRDDRHLAIALGGLTYGVSPLNLAEAYTSFATGGILRRARAIRKVTDADGREWPVNEAPGPIRVLSPEVAYLVTDMLQYVIEAGTGTSARIDVPAAGKTGSTNEGRDAWFVGYTADRLAVVYIGEDDNRPLPGGGAVLAAPIWRKVMDAAMAAAEPRPFPVPPGIVTGVPVDPSTGLRADDRCPGAVPTAFVRGTEPRQWAPCALDGREDASSDTNGGETPSERPIDDHSNPHRFLFLRRLLPFLHRPGDEHAETSDGAGPVASEGDATRRNGDASEIEHNDRDVVGDDRQNDDGETTVE